MRGLCSLLLLAPLSALAAEPVAKAATTPMAGSDIGGQLVQLLFGLLLVVGLIFVPEPKDRDIFTYDNN